MTFQAGQKVVCIDNMPICDWLGDVPNKDEIYTVAGMIECEAGTGVLLKEIRNYPFEGSYRATRFRPIVERKTDISIFTQMLTPHGVDA